MTYREGVLRDLIECGYEYEQASEIYDIASELSCQIPLSHIFDTPGYIFLIRNITILDTIHEIDDYRAIMEGLIDVAKNKNMTMYAMQHEILRKIHEIRETGNIIEVLK